MAVIPEAIIQQLELIAQAENRTLVEVLQSMLKNYSPPRRSSLAEMAQNAREANLASEQAVETADHSREILQNEYADYLKHRMESHDDHH